jgi:hypothetical protein
MAAKFVVIVEDVDLDAFCLQDHYQTIVADPDKPGQSIANPETKEDYVERRVGEYVGNTAATGKTKLREETRKTEDEADKAATVIVTEKVEK